MEKRKMNVKQIISEKKDKHEKKKIAKAEEKEKRRIRLEKEVEEELEREKELHEFMENNDCSKEFSEEKFFDKIMKYAKKIGAKIVYYMLILFYTLQEPSVPLKAKAVIVGSLGYFIIPFDLIPDLTPGGHVDDVNVIIGALAAVMLCITPAVKEKAKQKLKDIFGEDVEENIETFEEELNEKMNMLENNKE